MMIAGFPPCRTLTKRRGGGFPRSDRGGPPEDFLGADFGARAPRKKKKSALARRRDQEKEEGEGKV